MRFVQAFLLDILCLQGFHNLTPNDLWPPPKTIGFLYSMWYTYKSIMRSVQASLIEISCLQGFHNLTPVDPKWPLTSTNNNRLFVLILLHLHTKYEICQIYSKPNIKTNTIVSLKHISLYTTYKQVSLHLINNIYWECSFSWRKCFQGAAYIYLQTRQVYSVWKWLEFAIYKKLGFNGRLYLCKETYILTNHN